MWGLLQLSRACSSYVPAPPPNLSSIPLPMTWSVWMTTCSWGISTSLTSARSILSRSWSRIDTVRSSGTFVPSLLSEDSSWLGALEAVPSMSESVVGEGMSTCGEGQALVSTAPHHLTKATSIVRATAKYRQGHGSGRRILGCHQVIHVGGKDCGKTVHGGEPLHAPGDQVPLRTCGRAPQSRD